MKLFRLDLNAKESTFTEEELRTFHPAVCNRLDRNTSGLITAGKSLAGLQVMSELFKDRTLKKYYLCVVKGKIEKSKHIKGFLKKDEKTNKVEILKSASGKDVMPIETEYLPTLEEMGIDKYIEVVQGAVDRYYAR